MDTGSIIKQIAIDAAIEAGYLKGDKMSHSDALEQIETMLIADMEKYGLIEIMDSITRDVKELVGLEYELVGLITGEHKNDMLQEMAVLAYNIPGYKERLR